MVLPDGLKHCFATLLKILGGSFSKEAQPHSPLLGPLPILLTLKRKKKKKKFIAKLPTGREKGQKGNFKPGLKIGPFDFYNRTVHKDRFIDGVKYKETCPKPPPLPPPQYRAVKTPSERDTHREFRQTRRRNYWLLRWSYP